jgi:uncharacterized protein (TIGR02646 family)
MHHLTRPYPEPEALQKARKAKPSIDWDHFSTKDKKTVRDALLVMQDCRCAYCERTIRDVGDEQEDKWDGHIEHFQRKDSSFCPDLTFVWENLFLSCNNGQTCGHRKDAVIREKNEYADLINPCKENPEHFFVFAESGKVHVRSGLTETEQKRAQFTIKVFGLNAPCLIRDRLNLLNGFLWLKDCSNEDRMSYLNDSRTKVPFITALFHYYGEKVVS